MAKVIFTTSESSAYDDQPDWRYHFPSTYLAQAKQAEGDWIVYYEPRRTSGPSSATGRKAYFAMAQVERIEPDDKIKGHYYAYLKGYIQFDHAVLFREGSHYFESALVKGDGSTNRGAFGRSVRVIPEDEFSLIVNAGFTRRLDEWEKEPGIAESVPDYVVRPIVDVVVSRRFRDEAFRRHVRTAYSNTCAVTGLKLLNGGGRPEVQAAHIRPVENDGPDTVRNGLALTGTIHWLFDRGLISIDDSFNVLVSPQGLPGDLIRLIRPEKKLLLPENAEWRPHSTYLAWHRENRFNR